ncbi:WD40 repeat-like protein [Calocera cornea HHB12733]|uniref:WD40 repeat-like protein n=1 Tax=Calocera cornea HHB12733 TaxID=1353952 RepID=A0A165CPB5_9BASI|nr:WD40 repeat-like protein [Calocera cornea HHB12733]
MTILEDVKLLAINADLQNIPFVGEAGHEPQKECLANTRTALLDEIGDWAASGTERVFILRGEAGTGKSAVAHTMAGRFQKMKRLGATFCFNSTPSRKPVALFRNLAHGLASFHSAFKAALQNSVKDNKDLCTTADVEQQFVRFILDPAKALNVNGAIFIVIDAFDESGTIDERQALLRIIRDRFQELPAAFRILITSRDEYDILKDFSQSTAHVVVRRMPTVEEDAQLSQDLLRFIEHSVSRDGPSPLSRPQCATLRDKSEGLFQWAFVACRYIVGPAFGKAPITRYRQLVTGNDTGLDPLYHTVLSRYLGADPEHLDAFKTVMGVILTTIEPLSMADLDILLRELNPDNPTDVFETLRYFGSLLSGVQEDTVPVRPLHSTFSELLRDSTRGGTYCVGPEGHHENITRASLRLLNRGLHFNMGELKTSYVLNRDIQPPEALAVKPGWALVYASKHWGYHLSECRPSFARSDDELGELVTALLLEKLLFWLETASLSNTVTHVITCLLAAMESLKALGETVCNMAEECIRFIRTCAPPIIASSAHIYLSALVWAPSESMIVHHYRSAYPRLAEVRQGRDHKWPVMNLVLSGHTGGVTSIAFSPDGRRIVSGSWDHTLRLWNADTGAAMREPLTGHDRQVTSVAFSPDGRRIVSGSWENTLRLWNADTGAAIDEPLTGHTDGVLSVALSPDSRRIVSGSGDGTLRLWNADTGAAMGEPLTGHDSEVTSVAFSPDGRRIVSGSWDHTLRLWNADTGAAIGEPLTGHTGEVASVAFSPDGRRIVSGSWDHTLRLWNADTGAAIGEPLTGHTGEVYSVAFSPDGRRIVSGSSDHTLRLWNADTGAAIGEPLTGHTGEVYSVAFSPDGRRIVSGSGDGTLRLWNADTGAAIGEPLTGHDGEVYSVAFSPDGRRIVSGSGDGTLRLWNADTGAAIGEPLTGHDSEVASVAFSPDGRRIVSGSWDHTLRLWNADTGAAIGEPLTGSWDHTVGVWYPDITPSVMMTCVAGAEGFASVPGAHVYVSGLRRSRSETDLAMLPADRTGQALSLSPFPAHQMTQRYPRFYAERTRISFDLKTGWIQGNGKDHLLWVPPDKLRRLYGANQLRMVIPGPTIHLDLSKFVHGTRWTECRLPLDRETVE